MTDQSSTPFLRSILSEPNGSGSTARLCVLLVVIFALLWVTYLVCLKREIPALEGLTVWVVGTTTSLYGVNKLAKALAPKEACDE